MNLFNLFGSQTLGELATYYTQQFNLNRQKRLDITKAYLISSTSIIRTLILNSAKTGQSEVIIDFDNLNRMSLFGNFDYLFTSNELDELIVTTTQFLETQNCNYNVNGLILVVNWGCCSSI